MKNDDYCRHHNDVAAWSSLAFLAGIGFGFSIAALVLPWPH